jgi:hypothetical protein
VARQALDVVTAAGFAQKSITTPWLMNMPPTS